MAWKQQALSLNMPSRSNPLRRNKGFVLLHTLWLLLAASVAVSAVLVTTNRTSEEFAANEMAALTEVTLESGVQLVIYELLTKGVRSPLVQQPSVRTVVNINGENLELSVSNVDGFLDVGTADLAKVEELVRQVAGERSPHSFTAPLRRARGTASESEGRAFASYAELQSLLQLPPKTFECLYHYITLFSGRSQPNTLFARPRLIARLGLKSDAASASSALAPREDFAEATYRIDVRPLSANMTRQAISTEVTITGQLRPSNLIRSWRYLPDYSPTCA